MMGGVSAAVQLFSVWSIKRSYSTDGTVAMSRIGCSEPSGATSRRPREVVVALEDHEYLNLGTGEDFNAIDERVFNALSDEPRSIVTIAGRVCN